MTFHLRSSDLRDLTFANEDAELQLNTPQICELVPGEELPNYCVIIKGCNDTNGYSCWTNTTLLGM